MLTDEESLHLPNDSPYKHQTRFDAVTSHYNYDDKPDVSGMMQQPQGCPFPLDMSGEFAVALPSADVGTLLLLSLKE